MCFIPTTMGSAQVKVHKKGTTAEAAPAAAWPDPSRPPAAPATTAAATAAAGAPATAAAAAAMAAATWELGAEELEPCESAGEKDGQWDSSADESDVTVGHEERSLGSGSDFEPPSKRRRRREGSRSGGGSRPPGASPNWSGLEEGEADEGVYSLTLPAAAFKEGGSLKIHTPGGRHGLEAVSFLCRVGNRKSRVRWCAACRSCSLQVRCAGVMGWQTEHQHLIAQPSPLLLFCSTLP